MSYKSCLRTCYTLPDYVKAEPINRGAYTGKYIPRGTGGTMPPATGRAFKAVQIQGTKVLGESTIAGSSINGSSINGSTLAKSSLSGSSLGNTEVFELVPTSDVETASTPPSVPKSIPTSALVVGGLALAWLLLKKKRR